jgi:diguanylate cyclase (GGDEF)-like protein
LRTSQRKKAAEKALSDSRHELERRVLERTEELAQSNAQLLTEVSERKAVEQHLRASEARFRDLSEMTSDWFWEQDLNFRFKDMSHGLLETDFDPKSTLGKTRRELPILGLTEGEWQKHEEALHAHQPFKNFVYQFESGPSDLRWFSISGKPVFENGVFTGYRGSGSDITSSKVAEQQIAFLAYHDSLTGIPNRLLLQHRVSKAIAHADRSRTQLALLFLDLDNFKKINDSLGHAAGDLLLKEIASRLGECVRDTDTISRQGGDEFVIVLSNLPEHDGTTPVLTKILERLQDPFVVDGNELSTSVSIGIAAYPKDGEDFKTLSKKSDMTMSLAKEAGRNTFRFFDETMNGEAVQHLVIRNGLRRALERSEFSLYYQPQIDLISGAVVGAEALTHWHHPELGMVSPANFIPIAEESGLIIPLGEWVLREACSQAVNWQKAGLPKFLLAVNLSAVQFRRGNVEQLVFDALDQSGLDPELLELELTETTLIQNVDQVLTTIKAPKRLGVKLAIDDFGTSYSSLSYLKRFNVDKLKIDQSFVRDLATDPDDAAIVKAIIQMAHSLNLQALAEGVENLEILERLDSILCDQAQGYHFARPMLADQFAAYLARQAVT